VHRCQAGATLRGAAAIALVAVWVSMKAGVSASLSASVAEARHRKQRDADTNESRTDGCPLGLARHERPADGADTLPDEDRADEKEKEAEPADYGTNDQHLVHLLANGNSASRDRPARGSFTVFMIGPARAR
jgi:hypothetical protein